MASASIPPSIYMKTTDDNPLNTGEIAFRTSRTAALLLGIELRDCRAETFRGGGCATQRQIQKTPKPRILTTTNGCATKSQVSVGRLCFGLGICTPRSRCATTAALLLGIEVCDCCAETIRATPRRRRRRRYGEGCAARRQIPRRQRLKFSQPRMVVPQLKNSRWHQHSCL
jgi:hypothetical protein